jgi:hypothetical protein
MKTKRKHTRHRALIDQPGLDRIMREADQREWDREDRATERARRRRLINEGVVDPALTPHLKKR